MWKVISESTSTVEMDANDSVQVGPVGGSSAAASARSLLYTVYLALLEVYDLVSRPRDRAKERVRSASIERVGGTDLKTECVRKQDERVFNFNDHRAEERICALSWADELRLYQCYWRESLHRSTIEATQFVVSMHFGRETRRLAAERGHKGRG